MNRIQLEGLEFFAHHGYYEAEQKLGNRYSVDVAVETTFDGTEIEDDLQQTINYENLYTIVREQMAISSKLLEHIAARITRKILDGYADVAVAEVTIKKHNPPLGGICRAAVVTLRKSR